MKSTNILAIASSLRKGSTSTALLKLATSKLPSNHSFKFYVPGDLPLFNEDIENDPNANVDSFRKAILEADGVLFGLCEYNAGLSAAVKNCLDWGSRGPYGNCFNNKPAGIISVGGALGGMRSQMNFRQVAVNINLQTMNHPTVAVNIFDPTNKVIDATTGGWNYPPTVEKQVEQYIDNYIKWVEKMK